MNPTTTVFDRFGSISDYLQSGEYSSNTKANIFTPLRTLLSKPADNNSFLIYDINRKIASYLNLRDFTSFSSINVDNYLSLRSDHLLVGEVIENEVKARNVDKLVDLRKRATDTNDGMPVQTQHAPNSYNYPPPSQAFSIGPAQLTCNTGTGDFRIYRENKFGCFFQQLCAFANDESVNHLFRAHVCSLVIGINNTLDENGETLAVYYANDFLNIAKDVNNRADIEDKENKLTALAHMIKDHHISLRKLANCYYAGNQPDLNDWGQFLDSLRNNQ